MNLDPGSATHPNEGHGKLLKKKMENPTTLLEIEVCVVDKTLVCVFSIRPLLQFHSDPSCVSALAKWVGVHALVPSDFVHAISCRLLNTMIRAILQANDAMGQAVSLAPSSRALVSKSRGSARSR